MRSAHPAYWLHLFQKKNWSILLKNMSYTMISLLNDRHLLTSVVRHFTTTYVFSYCIMIRYISHGSVTRVPRYTEVQHLWFMTILDLWRSWTISSTNLNWKSYNGNSTRFPIHVFEMILSSVSYLLPWSSNPCRNLHLFYKSLSYASSRENTSVRFFDVFLINIFRILRSDT